MASFDPTTPPGEFGLAGIGDGDVVLPGPKIPASSNLDVRDYDDGTFTWCLVTGLEPAPNLGYQFVEPSHYKLDITPDLGWPNTEAMFQPYIVGETTVGNGRLQTFDLLVLGDNLTNNGDTTASYTISPDDMKRVLAPGFEKYLWRVRAISPNGHEGESSSIQAFRGRVVVTEALWTVIEPQSPSRTLTASIRGTRTPSITRVEINGVSSWTSYPSPTTWTAEVPLGPGLNVFFVRAFDEQGNGSEYRRVDVEVASDTLKQRSYFNRFDDFGYLMGLSRMPAEKNASYRTRIKDVYVHRAGPDHSGLINALNRELNLTYEDQAMLLSPAESLTGERRAVTAWLTPSHFYLSLASGMRVIGEYHEVEGNSLRFQLDLIPNGTDLVLESPLGTPIRPREYTLEDDGWVQFKKPLDGPVYASYDFIHRVDLGTKTVQQLSDALEALTHNGSSIVEVVVDSDVAGYLATGLVPEQSRSVSWEAELERADGQRVVGMPFRWSQAVIVPLVDRLYKDSLKNQYGSHFGTKYDAWARRLMADVHMTWGLLYADRNVWIPAHLSARGGSLPTVFDPHLGHWEVSKGGVKLSNWQAWSRGFRDWSDQSSLKYHGIPATWFHTGVGDNFDLLVIVDEQDVALEEPAEQLTFIGVAGDLLDSDLGIGASSVDSGA